MARSSSILDISSERDIVTAVALLILMGVFAGPAAAR
jgi:hypothetical protein